MRFGFVLLLTFLIGCGGSNDSQPFQYTQPETIDDGWETATLTEVGMNEEPILQMMGLLNNTKNHEVHSVLIVKDGLLVFETYFKGHDFCSRCADHHGPLVEWDMYLRHNMHSVSKTFTSTLIGIALDQGAISDVNEAMVDYMTQYAELLHVEKEAISIKHLLTMTSGLDWDETSALFSSTSNDLGNMQRADDPIRYILSKKVVETPGTAFHYSGGDTNLLGQVIREATGRSVTDFMNAFLFDPLEMEPAEWTMNDSNFEFLSSGLRLTPREMAKMGFVFINDGYWRSRRILSLNWIEQATQAHIAMSPTEKTGAEGYGFQWWMKTYRIGGTSIDCFYAGGWGGQRIICIPELNMVAAFTGANYARRYKLSPDDISPEKLMAYILEAAV